MEILYGIEKLAPEHQNAVVSLGFFDGIHKGHQALIQRAKTLAESSSPKKKVLVYTFDRHPLEIVDPPHAPLLLTTTEEKIRLVSRLPVDILLIGEFKEATSKLSPETFLRQIVRDRLKPGSVAVGFNYRYGKGHQGNVHTLVQDAPKLGFSVTVVEPCIVDGEAVSSTRIRRLLLEGDVQAAKPLLGYWYSLEGTVIRGEGRGKLLGFPTANLETPPRKLIPKPGIYAGIAHIERKPVEAVVSIGKRPTFGGTQVIVEAYLLDFQDMIYGKKISLDLLARRREEEKFDSPEALVEKMKEDVLWGRSFLHQRG